MNFILSFKSVITTILITILFFNKCCIIGLGFGAISDSIKPDSVKISLTQLSVSPLENSFPTKHIIKIGDNVVLDFKCGDRISGEYLGYMNFSLISYKNEYDSCSNSYTNEGFLPRVGDKINILYANKMIDQNVFLGLDYERIHIINKKRHLQSIELNQIIKSSNNDDKIYNIDLIRKLIKTEDLPIITAENIQLSPQIKIQVEQDVFYFSSDKVANILKENKKNGKLTGFLIGGAADLLLYIVIKSSQPFKIGPSMKFN